MFALKGREKTAAILGGVAALAAGIYLYFSKNQKKKAVLLTDNQKFEIIDKIELEYVQGHLTLTTIGRILDAVVQLSGPGYQILTAEDRELRRANKDDLKYYSDIRDEFAHNIGDLIVTVQEEILTRLGIDYQAWEESNVFYRNEGIREIDMILQSVPVKLRMNLPAHRNLSKEELIEIIRAKSQLIEREILKLEEYSAVLDNQRKLVIVTDCRIKDEIYEMYGAEEEDIDKAMKEYGGDTEIQTLIRESKKYNQQLLSSIQQ